MRTRSSVFFASLVFCLSLWLAPAAQAQVNTVNLSGVVLDPQNLPVKGAQVTAKNIATGSERGASTSADGRYVIVGLPPGTYSLTVEAQGFAAFQNPSLTLQLGLAPEYNAQLQLKAGTQNVSVSAAPDLVETAKTDVSRTIGSLQIDNLPINGRNYINFTLLDSQAARDETPSIGAAPTSGLNFGGQRARSNEVSVDGADAVDNSVNGVRTTVSQEAVQEFQVITSNYQPEYGRAMGGVVNIVTKSGTNDVHGDVFGFLRQSALQAQNPFSVQVIPNAQSGYQAVPVKQSYTRVQGGVTIGGPIQRDKTFYFFSYEITRRQETGFSSIGANNFDLISVAPPTGVVPALPAPYFVTAAQACATGATPVGGGSLKCTQPPAPLPLAGPYFNLAAAGSDVALFGNTPAFPGARFPSSGAPVPASYVGLASTIGNYPSSDEDSIWSLKLDHIWNARNTSFIRASVSPSTTTGIQVNAENQNFGQNAGSRTSEQQTRDMSIVFQHTTVLGGNLFNEFRYQFARRGLHYGYSPLPGGSLPAVNITGFAFFGREPFSTEDRIERRNEWTDDLTWIKGAHTFKFGADTNLLQLGSSKSQIFTLNYGGDYSFGSIDPGSLNAAFEGLPSLSAVQAYGVGIPSLFVQGVGQSHRPFDNKTLGVFAQDGWQLRRNLTLNYGARYDIEWLPSFKPGTSLNAAGEQAFGVTEGIPVDSNNVAPRIGIAWDPWGDGRTVIRAGYGFFYDHPALALAFLSTAEDGALSALLESGPGAPDPTQLNATSIFQGILGPQFTSCSASAPSACYIPSQQRFNAFQPNSIFINQNYISAGFPLSLLPFTIPIERNFQYALAQQADLVIEREITKDWKISAGYNFTHGTHLDRAININVTNPATLVANAYGAEQTGLIPPGSNPLAVAVPTLSQINAACAGGIPAYNVPGGGSIAFATPTGSPLAPGILGLGYTGQSCGGTPVGFVGTPAVFNFFRPSGPNPSYAALVPGGYSTLLALAQAAGYPLGFTNAAGPVQIPWSDVDPQTSTGNSIYNAFTLTMTKRFSGNMELLSSWTYSHTIDDSTDLTTLLNPQDNSNPDGERGNSDFDQRHRWITSAVFMSPHRGSGATWWRRAMADFTVAPVIELASGRPYNVLLGSNTNLDLGTATNRPSVLARGVTLPPGFPPPVSSPFIPGVSFIIPTDCLGPSLKPFGPYPATVASPPYGCVGDLGRNAFTRPGFFQVDLRIARTFPITERWKLEMIADSFNLLNRFNVSDVNPLCDPTSGTCSAGTPTSAFDPRTFQFALKLHW